MNADGLHADETEKIIGCAFRVRNALGHGYHENPYENGLVVEFRYHNIPYAQQLPFNLTYRDEKVGEYIPDLIVFGKVIVDTKTIEQISDREIGRMPNYLRATGLRVGLIINFKHAKLQFRRVAPSDQSPPHLRA